MRRILVPLLALVAVAVVAVCWSLRHDGVSSLPTPGTAAQSDAPTEPALDALSADPLAVKRETATPAAATATQPLNADLPATNAEHRARLIVRVLDKATSAPLKDVRINVFATKPELRPSDGSKLVPGAVGSLETTPITGADGRVEFDLPAGIELELSIFGDNDRGPAFVHGIALYEGERREIALNISVGLDTHLVGKVVNWDTREPIAGAHVQLARDDQWAELDSKLQVQRQVFGQVITQGDGMFEFRFSSWQGHYLRIEADGFGLAVVVPPETGHTNANDPFLIVLAASASLDIRISDRATFGIAGAEVSLTANGYELDTEQPSVLTSRFVTMSNEVWRATTEASGRCAFKSLPPRVPLRAEVSIAGKLVRRERDPLTLQPAETRSVEWTIGTGTKLFGVAVDQSNAPVPGLAVWLESGEPSEILYFQLYDQEHVTAKTTTDDKGRFTFDDIPPGRWRIGPAASNGEWKPAGGGMIAPLAVLVDVLAVASQDLTLRVYRDLFIRGHVAGPRGEAVRLGFVTALQGKPLYLNAQIDDAGAFALGPLGPGSFDLIASATDYASSDPVSARTGDTDVLLRLKPGARLRGRVIDRLTRAACPAQVIYSPEVPGSGPFGRGMGKRTEANGTFEANGLEPGRWRLVATTEDGRFGVLTVTATIGASSETHELAVDTGGTLSVRYVGSSPQVLVTIVANGMPVAFPKTIATGETKKMFGPVGALTLEVRSNYEDVPRLVSVDLGANEEKAVVITDGK